jgi:hypothetical protein
MGGRKSGTQLALCQAVKRPAGWRVGTGCKAMPRVRLYLSNRKQINNQEPERMALS